MLQAIDPFQLPSLPLSQAADLPEAPSIYFVLDGDKILYIGRSVKLRQRWDFSRSHHVLPRLFERTKMRVAWLECSDPGLMGDVEMALINHFEPPLNIRRQSKLTEKDSVQVSVIMPKELKERLQEFAKPKRWSLSQAGLVLIEEALDRAEAEAKGKGER